MTRPATLILLVLTLACSGGPEPPSASEATRIVSLAPSLTEILFALGVGDRVVGVTRFCDYPPEATALPKVGGFANPSSEAVLALAPDLVVVAPAAGNRNAALAIRRAGVRVEVVGAETYEDTFTAIARLAELTGVPERGEALTGELRRRVDAVRSRIGGREPVRTLFCLQADPLLAAGRGTLPAQILELAGGENLTRADRYPRLSMETVVARAPAVILQSRMDQPPPGAQQAAVGFWSRWETVPAVRDGRVYLFDGTTAMRAGPRVAEAVESLARMLHPDAFEEASR